MYRKCQCKIIYLYIKILNRDMSFKCAMNIKQSWFISLNIVFETQGFVYSYYFLNIMGVNVMKSKWFEGYFLTITSWCFICSSPC